MRRRAKIHRWNEINLASYSLQEIRDEQGPHTVATTNFSAMKNKLKSRYAAIFIVAAIVLGTMCIFSTYSKAKRGMAMWEWLQGFRNDTVFLKPHVPWFTSTIDSHTNSEDASVLDVFVTKMNDESIQEEFAEAYKEDDKAEFENKNSVSQFRLLSEHPMNWIMMLFDSGRQHSHLNKKSKMTGEYCALHFDGVMKLNVCFFDYDPMLIWHQEVITNDGIVNQEKLNIFDAEDHVPKIILSVEVTNNSNVMTHGDQGVCSDDSDQEDLSILVNRNLFVTDVITVSMNEVFAKDDSVIHTEYPMKTHYESDNDDFFTGRQRSYFEQEI
jgi:hypothetical protein